MLLMGSSNYREKELSSEIQQIIDSAINHEMTLIVDEALGAAEYFNTI